MTKNIKILLGVHRDAFQFFEDAYVFGSALVRDYPNDIDILLIYDERKLRDVRVEKARLATILGQVLPDCVFDFTTLSKGELVHTNFLERVRFLGLTN